MRYKFFTLSLHDALPISNFIANMLGYGGGPATLPLLKKEIVDNYGLLTNQEFSEVVAFGNGLPGPIDNLDRKSTRLNSSHVAISYAVFCLKKKTERHDTG